MHIYCINDHWALGKNTPQIWTSPLVNIVYRITVSSKSLERQFVTRWEEVSAINEYNLLLLLSLPIYFSRPAASTARSSASPARQTVSPARQVTPAPSLVPRGAPPDYVSANRMQSKGPNKEYAKGPDSSLLMWVMFYFFIIIIFVYV